MSAAVPILMYHSIDTRSAPRFEPWVLSPALFSEHMDFLKDEGYTVWTVSQFVARAVAGRQPPPEKTVVITVDDAFLDFYETALPILSAHGFPATLYVPTACVGKTSAWLEWEGEADRPLMSWDQLREIGDRSDVEIGAHSCTHPHLDHLSRAEARDEVERSKSTLEDHLGRPVLSFAYPYGDYNKSVLRWVESAGFTSACGVRHAFSSPADDPLALARVIVSGGMTGDDLRQLLTGGSLRVAPFPEPLMDRFWRFYGRVKARLNIGRIL